MIGFLLRRLGQTIPIVLLVATLVFSLIHLIPGDPIEMMLGEGAQRSQVEELRHELGLDRPLATQYSSFLGGLVRGDLGDSLHFREPVVQLLLRHYPATLELTLASMIVALLVSVPLGVIAASRRNRFADHFSRMLALLGVSIPNFWLGPMLILLFAIQFDWFPVSGRGGWLSLVLPAVTLGTALSGLLTRMVRSSVAEELEKPYLAAALAPGRSPKRRTSSSRVEERVDPGSHHRRPAVRRAPDRRDHHRNHLFLAGPGALGDSGDPPARLPIGSGQHPGDRFDLHIDQPAHRCGLRDARPADPDRLSWRLAPGLLDSEPWRPVAVPRNRRGDDWKKRAGADPSGISRRRR